MIFIPWFGQVEDLPTSTLWHSNGRGLHSTPFKRSNDPLEYHGFLPYSWCFPCEESPQVGASHPHKIYHNENHKSKGGKETHAKARVATMTRTQVKKRGHKHSSMSSQLNRCSNLNHSDPNTCLWSLGVLGCSMEAWYSVHAPRGPFYSPKATRSPWISIW
jgi:hypothetical protein